MNEENHHHPSIKFKVGKVESVERVADSVTRHDNASKVRGQYRVW
jgi:hypothetical protein